MRETTKNQPIGHWKATSSYDIYMVDTPKEGNGDGTTEDDPSKKQPKRRRPWHRSKSHQRKNGDSSSGDNNTPDSAEDNPLRQDSAQEDGVASPHERAADREVEDDNYMPPPKMRQASTTTNLSCLRIPSNKSISNAGLWPWQAASRKSRSSLELTKIC